MLPNINSPEFSLDLPSSGKTVFFRPFLVKEEKILLMALEGNKKEEIDNALAQILTNCVKYDGDVMDLPFIDLEYIFVNIRAKSIDNIIKLRVGHKDTANCNHLTDYEIDINDVEVENLDNDNKIMLNDSVGLVMKYPTLKTTNFILESKSNIDNIFSTIAACIDYVFDNESVYEDATFEEKMSFVENMSKQQFEKVMDFISKLPTLKYDIKYTCDVCSREEHITLRGMQNFFV